MILSQVLAVATLAAGVAVGTFALAQSGVVGSGPPAPAGPTPGPRTEPEPPKQRPAGPAEVALHAVLGGNVPVGDAYELTFALRRLARARHQAGDRPGALAILEVADRVAGTVPNPHLRRLAVMRTAVTRGQLGDANPARLTLAGFAREGTSLKGQARFDLMAMVIDFQNDAGFPLEARQNLKAELAVVDMLDSPNARDSGIYRFLATQVQLGDYDGALDQAARYSGVRSNIRAGWIQTILHFQTAPGKAAPLAAVHRAVGLVNEVTYPYPRALAEVDVAAALARAGDIPGALAVARGIDEPKDSPFEIRGSEVPAALIEIARVQIRAGEHAGARALLDEALEVLGTLRRRDVISNDRVERIVAARAEIGDIAAAIAAAKLILGDQDNQALAQVAIAQAQSRAHDPAAARATLAAALAEAKGIARRPNTINDNPGERLDAAIRAIALAQAEVGDVAAARDTVANHGDDGWKLATLAEVAPIQARRGDYAGALATARANPGSAAVYATLGRIQAEAGDPSGALSWAAQLAGPAHSFAIVGINEGTAMARSRPAAPR